MGLFSFLRKKKSKNISNDSLNKKIREERPSGNRNNGLIEIKKDKYQEDSTKNETLKSNNKRLFTPNRIDKLSFNEVFVFGSNLQGHHNGGAAKIALEKFGAKYGQGIGMQGQSYAIPTMQGDVETIIPYINDFIDYAQKHNDRFFFVTRIGCGIAGFKDEQIAPLFEKALSIPNIILPKSFVHIIKENQVLKIKKIKEYGQARAIADIIKALNNKNKYDSLPDLLKDLNNTIDEYTERGTITHDSLSLIKSILLRNEFALFFNNKFDINSFERLLEDHENINEELENIFKLQTNIKLLNVIKFLNKEKKYSSSFEIINDLSKLSKSYIFNQYNPEPLYFLTRGLHISWDEITKNGILDNDLLEKVIFKDHEDKVKKLGLKKVIEIDYEQGGCHTNVYSPQKNGTAPIYVKLENDEYIKSCGQGVGPYGDPNYFEEQLLRILNGC